MGFFCVFFFLMAQISVYLFLPSVSSQGCLTVVTNFKNHGFNIPSVHQTHVEMLVELSGTPLQARPEPGSPDWLWIRWGKHSRPQLLPTPRGHTYMAQLYIGCWGHWPTLGTFPILPSPSSASHQFEKVSSLLCLRP